MEFRALINKTSKLLEGAATPSVKETSNAAKPSAPKPQTEVAEPEFTAKTSFGKREYKLLTDVSEIKSYVATLLEQKAVAFDTETTGLDIVSDKPIGVSFCYKTSEAVYIPLDSQHLE